MKMISQFKGPARQRGMVATLIAIIVLVSTLLAVVGLMRSVDTANLIAGTMSFRQSAMQEAERAYVAAKGVIPSCAADATNAGVYHAALGTADTIRSDLPQLLTQQAVHGTATAGLGSIVGASTGNDIYYIVERMCRTSGTIANSANCILASASTGLSTTSDETFIGGAGAGGGGVGAAKATYRLSIRVDGPKNVQAYVQTVFGRKNCI